MNIRISDLKKIAKKVKTIKCAEHKETASVVIKDGSIELSGFCCEDFDEKLHESTKNLVIKQVVENEKEKAIAKAKKNYWDR